MGVSFGNCRNDDKVAKAEAAADNKATTNLKCFTETQAWWCSLRDVWGLQEEGSSKDNLIWDEGSWCKEATTILGATGGSCGWNYNKREWEERERNIERTDCGVYKNKASFWSLDLIHCGGNIPLLIASLQGMHVCVDECRKIIEHQQVSHTHDVSQVGNTPFEAFLFHQWF